MTKSSETADLAFDTSPAALQARAAHQVKDSVGDADELVAAPLAQQAGVDSETSQTTVPNSRPTALLPTAASLEIALMAQQLPDSSDALSFLASPPRTRPDNVPLDDAGLHASEHAASAPGIGTPDTDRGSEHRSRLERDEIETNLASELAGLEIRQLYFLRSLKEVPDVVMQAAAIERLLNMVIRLLSLGLVKRESSIQNALDARRALADRSDVEIQRRKRTPQGIQQRRKALEEHQAAVREQLKRHEAGKVADYLSGSVQVSSLQTARQEVELEWDRTQAAKSKPTLAAARRAVTDADEAYTLAGARVPRGLMRMLKRAEFDRSMKAAEERRKRARQILQLLLERFDRDVEQQIATRAAQIDEDEKRARLELERLKLEHSKEFAAMHTDIDRDAANEGRQERQAAAGQEPAQSATDHWSQSTHDAENRDGLPRDRG